MEFNFQQRLSKDLAHSAIRPYNEKFNDAEYIFVYIDTLVYQKWIFNKLYKESLLDIKEKGVHLQFDPLFNLTIGNKNQTDQYRIFYNTRGFRVMGDLGKKISLK